jgi:hypothetical protein
MNRSGPSVKTALFSQKNRTALQQLLVQDFQRREGQSLNEKQLDRLERALDHYVEQVYGAQGEQPLPILNREVLKVTAQDFSKYLQRQNVVLQQSQTPTQTVMNQQLFMDTARRFDQIQTDRQEVKALPPPIPDFRVSLDDDGPSSVDLYEQAKKQRESEAQKALASSKDAMERMDPGVQQRIQADDMFRQSQQNQNKATDLALQTRRQTVQPLEMPLVVPPDGRELFLMDNPGPRVLGDANSNPTTTIPPFLSPTKINLPQDYLIRQENTVTYKEIENNLFLYSADRDWIRNVAENRYNFSVTFDPGNNGQGYYPQVRVQQKFKNITRIEFVKAILPLEGLDVMILPDASGCPSKNTSFQSNVLSLPFVSVNIPELENNNFGTDNFLDRCFSVIQYDQNWFSDRGTSTIDTVTHQTNDSRGFTAMVPRFLKCQKIYAPAPLSTLQRLTINLLRPSGQPLSLLADTFDISGVYAGTNTLFANSAYDCSGSGNPQYIFIQTTNYFSRFQMNVGDNIQIGNFAFADPSNTIISNPVLQDFTNWINRPTGFLVSGIGHTDPSGDYRDGPNNVGYANYIIIQAQYQDPTTGNTGLRPYGGGNITTYIGNTPAALANPPRRLINLSRQIQLVFRIITREMDPVAQLRPDNM